MIVLNEKKYAEECLEQGVINKNIYFSLVILSKYYYHHLGYRKKKIQKKLLEFLSEYYPRYQMEEFTLQSLTEKLSKKAGNYPLFEIDGVRITKLEMAAIQNINNKVLERLAFTMLCLAKLGNLKSEKNNGWVNHCSKEIFALARIACKADERDERIGELNSMGLLEFSKRNDNLNCRVTFIADDDEEVLFVNDFRELGYEYLKYKGENFIRCVDCGILTRGNKNGTKKYCKDCVAYTPQEVKTIICSDCGKKLVTNSMNNRSIRCNECQEIINREKKRIWKNERNK